MIEMEEQGLDEFVTLSRDDEFDRVLIKMKEIHDKKKEDYSDINNRFSNFEYSAQASGITVAQVFEVLISTKQARLIELMKGKVPKNEPIGDTLLDRAVYCVLAYAYHLASVDASTYYKSPVDGKLYLKDKG